LSSVDLVELIASKLKEIVKNATESGDDVRSATALRKLFEYRKETSQAGQSREERHKIARRYEQELKQPAAAEIGPA
jgi:hypothetical protein